MKKLIIPLLVATALLSGCHRVSVRHTVDLPVKVVEHRHVHAGAVVVHKHHHRGDSATHHHSKPRHHTPKHVVVVTPPPVVRHREVTVYNRHNHRPAPPVHTRSHSGGHDTPSHSGHSRGGRFMQHSVHTVRQLDGSAGHTPRTRESGDNKRTPHERGSSLAHLLRQQSGHNASAHGNSSRQENRGNRDNSEHRGNSSTHRQDNGSHSDNASVHRGRERDKRDDKKDKRREKGQGEDKHHKH